MKSLGAGHPATGFSWMPLILPTWSSARGWRRRGWGSSLATGMTARSLAPERTAGHRAVRSALRQPAAADDAHLDSITRRNRATGAKARELGSQRLPGCFRVRPALWG